MIVNTETIAFLQLYPPPPDLARYADAVAQLPLSVVISIVGEGSLHDCSAAEIGQGLESAVAFGSSGSYPCAACFRWVPRAIATPVATLIFLDDGAKKFVFYALCPMCNEAIEAGDVSPEMASRLRSSIFGE